MNTLDYIWEIFQTAGAEGVDLNIAKDMVKSKVTLEMDGEEFNRDFRIYMGEHYRALAELREDQTAFYAYLESHPLGDDLPQPNATDPGEPGAVNDPREG